MSEASYISSKSTKLEVQVTDVLPCLEPLPIKAVLFDIYGTLMISASGDIGVANKLNKADALPAALLEVYGYNNDALDADLLLSAIAKDHELSKQRGHPFPEVNIVEIWQNVAATLGQDTSNELAERAALIYECATNPVWPMPYLKEALADIKESDLLMGIISNAQFYTPLLFPALIDQDLTACGFDEQLSWFSYQSKRAKPDTWMYEQARTALEARGVAAEEVLYVGNDMLNDMLPAATVGFKTALFAGDKRSLRLREDHPEAAQVQVDCIITDLRQLLEIL